MTALHAQRTRPVFVNVSCYEAFSRLDLKEGCRTILSMHRYCNSSIAVFDPTFPFNVAFCLFVCFCFLRFGRSVEQRATVYPGTVRYMFWPNGAMDGRRWGYNATCANTHHQLQNSRTHYPSTRHIGHLCYISLPLYNAWVRTPTKSYFNSVLYFIAPLGKIY